MRAGTDAAAAAPQSAQATNSEPLPPELAALLAAQPAWSSSASLSTAIGYKDNLLLSPANPERSGFARAGVEALFWHVPKGRIDYLGFFNARATRYFTGQSVHQEGQAFAGLEWRYRVPDTFSFTLDAQGYYLDQVFDISDTEITRVVAELKLTGVRLGPTIRWSILPWLWLEGKAAGDRQRFRDGINDDQVRETSVRLGWTPGDRVELSLLADEQRRDYDRREKYTMGGRLDGGRLVIHERELEGRLVVTWGARGHWKTTTRAGGLHYLDNGVGYLNYRQRHVAQEIDWSAGDWLVHAEGEAARRDYDLQTAGRGIAPPPEVKDEFATQLRVERKLSEAWTVFGEFDWERTRCNDPIESYRMNEGLLGARWSWEK